MSPRKPQSDSSDSQITLFGLPKEAPDAFRKAVEVLHAVPSSELGLLQKKLGNAWLKNAIRTSPDAEGWWTISLKDLTEEIDFQSRNRKHLRECAKALMGVVYEYDVLTPGTTWKGSVFYPEVEILKDVVRYQISRQIQDKVLNPAVYALIDMRVIRRFSRSASPTLFEHCVRFERLGRTPELEWTLVRDMILGKDKKGGGSSNDLYKYFKSKHVVPAIREINEVSNHTIELVERRVGRAVKFIWFKVAAKASAVVVHEDEEQHLALIAELKKIGVPNSEAKKLIGVHGHESVESALEYTKRRAKDKKMSPLLKAASYFRGALTSGWARDDAPVVDSKPITERSAKTKKDKTSDLRQAFVAKRLVDAQGYFNELESEEQQDLIRRYNEQQETASLKLKSSRQTKLSQSAFLEWLAFETWGEPTTEDLLQFAAGMLAERS